MGDRDNLNIQLCILASAVAVMVSGISGKCVLDTTNLPVAGLCSLKSHLARCFPDIIGLHDSTALVSDGGLPNRKTARIGAGIPTNVRDRDGSDWARQY